MCTFSLKSWFIFQADPNQLEAELANGLIMGHAYSVTAVKMVGVVQLHVMELSWSFNNIGQDCQIASMV
jgi:hypothetical protein